MDGDKCYREIERRIKGLRGYSFIRVVTGILEQRSEGSAVIKPYGQLGKCVSGKGKARYKVILILNSIESPKGKSD